MSNILYEDDEVQYQGGDPRFEEMEYINTKLVLSKSELSLQFLDDTIAYEKASVHSVRIDDTNECALIVNVRDPEGIEADGFDISFEFRNTYHAKLFGKRINSAFGVPFSSETK